MTDTEEMRTACGLLTLCLLAPCNAQDARTIILKSLEAYERNDRLTRDYTYNVRNELRQLDSRGNLKSVHSSDDEVLVVAGKRYLHPLEIDGQPLPLVQARKEQGKLDRAVADASRLTAGEHARRVAAEENARAKQREPVYGIPDAFTFTLRGEETWNGRPSWVIDATPRPDFDGKGKALLRHLAGSFWIDKEDFQWARIEARALDRFWLGLFFAHIDEGAHLTFDMMKLKDQVWVPRRMSLSASARVLLLRKVNARQEVTFTDYRKFQSDSRLVTSEPE